MIGTPENERIALDPRDRKVAAEVALASNLVPPRAPSELKKYQDAFRTEMEQAIAEFQRQFPEATVTHTMSGVGTISMITSAYDFKRIQNGLDAEDNALHGGKVLSSLHLDHEEIPAALTTDQLYGRGLA